MLGKFGRLCLFGKLGISSQFHVAAPRHLDQKMFRIATQWDGKPLAEKDQVTVTVAGEPISSPDSVVLKVDAPFYKDAPPPAAAGAACDQLWDYEVVEAFFLGDYEKYLEVELCPRGQHLVLMLSGVRNMKKHMLPLDFTAQINEATGRWTGEARIPLDYFPPTVTHFNAYAIHGTGDARIYSSLYPAGEGRFQEPDFHRLQLFQPFDFASVTKQALPAASGKSSFW